MAVTTSFRLAAGLPSRSRPAEAVLRALNCRSDAQIKDIHFFVISSSFLRCAIEQRLENFVLAQDLGALGRFEVEGLMLGGDLRLLLRIESESAAAPTRGARQGCRAPRSCVRCERRQGPHHSVIDWMNFLVIESSILRWAMSTLRSVSTSRMFSLRSSIIWSKISDCICSCS